MTDQQTDTPAAEEPQTEHQKFGVVHILALLFAVGVTAAIFIFQDKLQNLDELFYLGAFLSMLIGNATVILPVPGLIFVFILGGTLNPLLVGLVAGPGAAIGEMTGYAAGYGGSAAIDNMKLYHKFKGWMEKYGIGVITVLAAIPNPVFDMAGIVAGSMRVKWWKFLIAAWIGKTIQGIAIAYAGSLSLAWVETLLH